MYRATLTLCGDFIWSGLFTKYPTHIEIIDRWRADDSTSPKFDNIDLTKEPD
jgi:hypothetical protein